MTNAHSPAVIRFTPELITPLAIGAALAVAVLVVRYFILKRVATSLVAPDAGISSLAWDARLASLMWCVALGAWGGLEAATLPPRLTAKLVMFVQVLVMASITITLGALLALALDRFARGRGLAAAATGLSRTLTRTPCRISSGAFHILIDRPVQVGDAVRLENGQEGEVEDIGWRSTRIRSEGGDLIIVPNAKLAQSILTNRSARRQSSPSIGPRRFERRG